MDHLHPAHFNHLRAGLPKLEHFQNADLWSATWSFHRSIHADLWSATWSFHRSILQTRDFPKVWRSCWAQMCEDGYLVAFPCSGPFCYAPLGCICPCCCGMIGSRSRPSLSSSTPGTDAGNPSAYTGRSRRRRLLSGMLRHATHVHYAHHDARCQGATRGAWQEQRGTARGRFMCWNRET
jgi:hypothetical protein